LAGIQDAADARVPVVDENEMARYLEGWGRRIVEHRGRPWEEVVRGFYRPVNLFARLSSLEATRPTWRCWGSQACLRDDQAHQANAALPVHRLRDFDCVTEDALPSSRRYKLRKARRLVEFVALTRADLLLHEGYEVFCSYRARTGYGSQHTKEDYLSSLQHVEEPGHGLVLAGLVHGRLGGYITGHAVDATAYIRELVVASEVLDTQISVGLEYEFFYACRRSNGIREVIHGLHTPENQGLCRHKEWLGLSVDRIPAIVRLAPGARAILRRRDRTRLYRLTGGR